MPYVPGYQCDLFLSYAHADDAQWVSVFADNLQEQLSRELGQPIKIWREVQQLAVAGDWKEEIENAIKQAAAFVTIVSPSYRASPWCSKERLHFLNQFCAQEQMREKEMPCLDKMKVGKGFRFFKIIKSPWPERAHEKFLPRLHHSQFCTNDEQALEYAPGTDDFRRELRRTCIALADLLRQMRSKLQKVFVATPTEDMLQACRRLRSDLHGQGYNVRPVAISELDFTVVDLLDQELEGAATAVFLLGAIYDPFVDFQLEEACRKGVRTVVWIAPGTEAKAEPRQQVFLRQIAEMESLPPSSYILPSVDLRAMIDTVVGLLSTSAEDVREPSNTEGVYLVYDRTDSEDRALGERWRYEMECKEKLTVYAPPTVATPEYHAELMRQCGGALLLQRSAPSRWLHQAAMDICFAEKLYRRSPLVAKCFLVNDPSLFSQWGVSVLSNPQEVNSERLESFIAPLRRSPGRSAGQ